MRDTMKWQRSHPLEPDSTIQVYGTPKPEVLQTMAALAQVDADADPPVVVREPFAGFDRLERRCLGDPCSASFRESATR